MPKPSRQKWTTRDGSMRFLPRGTRVQHTHLGKGTVNAGPRYDAIEELMVTFDIGQAVIVKTKNLTKLPKEIAHKALDEDNVALSLAGVKLVGDPLPDFEQETRRKAVIEQLCKMMGRVYNAIDPNGHEACDCVCKAKPDFRAGEHVLEVMEQAISALVGAFENPKNTEEHRGERVASNFSEEHLQRLIDDEKVVVELRKHLAKWFREHAAATRLRVVATERKPLVGVAIRDTEDRIWSLPKPLRHMHVQAVMREHGAVQKPDNQWNQGFIDEDGKYLTRKQAMVNAELHDQIKGGKLISASTLLSEDLW